MAENPIRPPRSRPRGGGYAASGLVAAMAVAVAVALAACGSEGDPPADAPLTAGVIDGHHPEVGRPAPDFALPSARDPAALVRLSDFRGTPVVLNWYASWCGPCRKEIPDFQKAYAALDGAVVFIGVNLQEDASQAAGLLDDLLAEYPALLDTSGEVAVHYRIPGMPATFFIDVEGVVRSSGAGLITEEILVEHLAAIGVAYTPE